MSTTADPHLLDHPIPAGSPSAAVLRLGVVPLIDAAPLLVADAGGFFRNHGVRVEIETVGSWATLRDKVAVGRLDGGQMLSPMPIAACLGLAGLVSPTVVAATLNRNGNTITLGETLLREIAAAVPDLAERRPLPAAALAAALAARRAEGRPTPVLAVVFGFSTHNYLLREWLASGGIDPERDVRLTVVPPPLVAEHLADGAIDGFCAGEPWGTRAADLLVGQVVVDSRDVWRDHPEKVLGFGAAEAARAPDRIGDAVAAVIAAGRWLDQPENHAEAARILCRRLLAEVPQAVVEAGLAGGVVFHAGGASFPHPAHGAFWLAQMRRWQHVPADADAALIARIWRADLWRRGAAQVGEPEPTTDRFLPDLPVDQPAGDIS